MAPPRRRQPLKSLDPEISLPSPSERIRDPRPLPWHAFLAIGFGVLFLLLGARQAGTLMLVLGGVPSFLFLIGDFGSGRSLEGQGGDRGQAFMGWAGLALLTMGCLSQISMTWAAPGLLLVPSNAVGPFLWTGGALLVASLLKPTSTPTEDWSPGFSRPILFILLGLGLALRFYRLGDIPSQYWDDWAEEIIDARRFLDFGHPQLIYPLGDREPFFNYFTAFLWWFMPSAPGLVVQRISSTALDMMTILLLYRVGKGLGGRKVGIFAVALAVVNKPLLTLDLVGIHLIALHFAVGLSILAFFHLVEKPDWGRFLLFGTALAGGIYTYSAFRPWLPFLLMVSLVWVLSREEERPVPIRRWALVALLSVSMVLAYLMVNPFMAKGSLLDLVASHPLARLLLLLSVPVLMIGVARQARAQGRRTLTLPWALTTVWAFLLASPILSQPQLTRRMGGLAIFNPARGYDLDFFLRLAKSLQGTLATLFVHGRDRGDFAIPWDVTLDLPAQVFILLGAAAFLARPTWKVLFLLLAGGVGISPHVLSNDPHMGKVLGAAFPMLLVAALGVERLLGTLAMAPRSFRVLGLLSLALLWGWGGAKSFDRLYLQWAFTKPASNSALAGECHRYSKTHRVYMSLYGDGFGSGPTQQVLQEGHGARLLKGDNPILLTLGERVPDLAVILSKEDAGDRARIQREFPAAEWTEILRYGPPEPGVPPLVERVLIPREQLGERPGPLFHIVRTGKVPWRRTFFDGGYSLRKGVILAEDFPEDPTAAIPVPNNTPCDIRGSYRMEQGGKVTFSVETANHFRLTVGGRKVFDLRPRKGPERAERTLSLPAGELSVEMELYFIADGQVPTVGIRTTPEGPVGHF